MRKMRRMEKRRWYPRPISQISVLCTPTKAAKRVFSKGRNREAGPAVCSFAMQNVSIQLQLQRAERRDGADWEEGEKGEARRKASDIVQGGKDDDGCSFLPLLLSTLPPHFSLILELSSFGIKHHSFLLSFSSSSLFWCQCEVPFFSSFFPLSAPLLPTPSWGVSRGVGSADILPQTFIPSILWLQVVSSEF